MPPKPRTRASKSSRAVLVTGFEPFGGDGINASALAVQALAGRRIGGRRIVVELLPVVFGAAADALRRAIRRVRPELVLCVGEAGGRAEIGVERVAINVDDARIADNEGARPIDRAIVAHGPVAYWSTLPIKAIVAAIAKKGIAAVVSQTAGTYVCNHVFYALMRHLARRRGVRGGFIHVPITPAQSRRRRSPTMTTARVVSALAIAIATALRTRRDVRASGGATS